MKRCLGVAACLLLLSASPTFRAQGYGEVDNDDAKTDKKGGHTTLAVGATDASDGTVFGIPAVVAANSPDAPSLFVWEVFTYQGNDPLANLCNAAQGPVGPNEIAWGWWYTYVAHDRVTGVIVNTVRECVAFPDPTNPAPPAPTPPPTPNGGQVWAAVPIPAPKLATSPVAWGVTGLETRVWAEPLTDVAVQVTLSGYTVTGVAHLVGYRWSFGEGLEIPTATSGTAAAPAARHTYERKGPYQLRATSVWQADATMTGNGINVPVPISLPTAYVTTTRDYQVVEIRSELVG